ncbi:HAMP domain-containing sensor histidine kinase [Phytohabitans sp. ZYX-F-186]|uniref:histidine kinase n=1 Tax=Phytohabitans maris TaxID=3071409 RepID=A0ABU0ZGN5_9ACTN|nr:HAMP domain-containing sensor histidine kinase [Phytohabitans sp. ZYX-F-186]MDQ7906225.1 HAMP domain-containing sensor histidine kinase [Phytohabitans sp. ZYX-F-186]
MSRLTIRARLTVLYGGLLFVAGVVLLAVTYVLVGQRMPTAVRILATHTRGPNDDPSVALPSGDQVYLSDLPEKLRDAALQDMLTTGTIALVLVTVVAVGFGWLLAGRALQPLHRITETAHRIAAAPAADRGLHERIALAGPRDEVKELADTFDTMLERLDRSFDGQRRFVANASHELRTPLTLSRAVLEYAAHRDTLPPEVRQLTELLLDINLRHERLINGLLLLARTDNEMLDSSPVDLADVVAHTVTHLAPEAEKAGVSVGGEPAPAPTLGDPVLLERLVQNLVENGIRHNTGTSEGWVRVACRTVPGGLVELTVSNSGPVIPRYEIPGLFEPFRRYGSERVDRDRGAGLGLSIVRSVARAHGGDVTAEPRDGGGLLVRVTLPLATGPGVA